MPEKVILSWSGGKDSTLALYKIKRDPAYRVVSLLTTINEQYDRISLHGVRRELVELQAEALGFPLDKVWVSNNGTNDEYEAKMRQALAEHLNAGVSGVVFGDIFLEDLKKYREEKLLSVGLKGIFPLWRKNSFDLACTFIYLGFKAVVTCVDTQVLDPAFGGREYDEQFLVDLSEGVDPCGENGEFHSFVYDGPIFHRPVGFHAGEQVLKQDRFFFCDLIPG
jgi:uncharacterized protein (TIGR00290 family)